MESADQGANRPGLLMLATALEQKQFCAHYRSKIICATENVVSFASLVLDEPSAGS